jgi:hypothetical protein
MDCQQSIRSLKEREFSVAQGYQNLLDMVLLMEISTRLLQAYLRIFQTVFTIIDVTSFGVHYVAFWANPNSVDDNFILTLILTMCIGSKFCFKEHQVS